jgi:hypothetical protein
MALPFCALYLDFLFVLQVNLCHSTKHWIVPTNARAVLFVRSFSVKYLIKFRLETEKKRENKQISQLIQYIRVTQILKNNNKKIKMIEIPLLGERKSQVLRNAHNQHQHQMAGW